MRSKTRITASIVALTLLLAACSSDEPSSTVSAQQECAAIEALEDSVTALTQVSRCRIA